MELTLKQKTAFGIGAVGKDMVYALSASYVMYYYQDVLGLSASFVGVVLMAARFFDAFNDPFMGVLVAKTRTRWGRFRPWIFSGTLLNALVLYALFAAPVLDEAALMVYFSVVYILWGVTYTMMDIPYWSMIPAVTRTPKDRENLSMVGRTCACRIKFSGFSWKYDYTHYWIVLRTLHTVRFDSCSGFAWNNQHLHPSTDYSVSPRRCHDSVSTSLPQVVPEY